MAQKGGTMKRHLTWWCLAIVISSLLITFSAFGGDESSSNLKNFAYSWKDKNIKSSIAEQIGKDIVSDSEGNIYVVGWADNMKDDVALIKFNKHAKPLWAKRWGGTDYDWATSVSVGLTGDIYVAGYTQSFGTGNGDVLLIKYNKDGKLIWSKTWGGHGISKAQHMELDSNENIYIAGSTSQKSLILKFDKDGNLLWSKTWSGDSPIHANAIALDSLGNSYVTGSTQSYVVEPRLFGDPDTTPMDIFLLKYSKDGELLWSKTWGGPRRDEGNAIALDKEGNIYVTGGTKLFKMKSERHVVFMDDYIMLLKYNIRGDLLWSKTWASYQEGGTCAIDIDVDKTENIFVSSYNSFFKFSKEGELLWGKEYISSSSFPESIRALALDPFNNILLTGWYRGEGKDKGNWKDKKGIRGQIVGKESSPEGNTESPTGTITSPSGSDKKFSVTRDVGKGILLLRYVQK